MTEIDFSDIEEKYAVTIPSTFDNIVVVDNIPVVDSSKEEKLLNVIKKIFKGCGTIKEDGIIMPKDLNSGKSKGWVVILCISCLSFTCNNCKPNANFL